jgi:hypothetical protein
MCRAFSLAFRFKKGWGRNSSLGAVFGSRLCHWDMRPQFSGPVFGIVGVGGGGRGGSEGLTFAHDEGDVCDFVSSASTGRFYASKLVSGVSS